MSLELETLDQLLGRDLSLSVIRKLYPDDERFHQAVIGLLSNGDVTLLTANGLDIPDWRRNGLLRESASLTQLGLKLKITEQGVRRIA